MAKNQIKIVPKRRDVTDVQRLAEALLDLIGDLSSTEKKRMAAEGKQVLKELGGEPRGSAA